jgi:hypothetical protein
MGGTVAMLRNLKNLRLRGLGNERGETLMTVLIASALVGMIMLAVAASITSAQKGAAGVEQQLGVGNITQSILSEMSDAQACKNTLGGMTMTAGGGTFASVPAIYDKRLPKSTSSPDTRVYIAGEKYESNHLRLQALDLKDYSVISGDQGNVTLKVTIKKVTETPGPQEYYRDIKIRTVVDGSNALTWCRAYATGDSLWKEVASHNGDIYYDAGKVGVGILAPVASLHVAGAGFSDQTNYADSPTAPMATGAAQTDKGVLLDGVYTDGRWRTRLVTVDRGVNLPLYVQQSGVTANSYTNVARFGTHQYDTNAFAVFGDAMTTGKLGVGTATPTAKFEVKAGSAGQAAPVEAIRIWGPNTPTNANSAQDLRWAFAAAGSAKIRSFRGGSWDTYLQFMTNPTTPLTDNPQVRMHIDQSGAIGIGTTAPTAQLDVVQPANGTPVLQATKSFNGGGDGTVAAQIIATDAGTADTGMRFVKKGTGGLSGANNFIWQAVANNAPVMTQKYNGFVGIMTDSPLTPLDVNGYIHVAGQTGVNIPVQGGYVSWNNTNGIGEMDFISSKGLGSGGFYFYNTSGGALTTTTPPLARIDGNGDVRFTRDLYVANDTRSLNFFATSDERMKKDIRPIENALEKVLSLEGVTYQWRSPASAKGPQLGVIAQKVRKIYPEAVREDEKGFLSVSYNALIAPLIEAFKAFYQEWIAKSAEQDRKIEALETELKAQREEFTKVLREQHEEIEALKSSLRARDTSLTK